MDLINTVLFCFISLVLGGVFMLLMQYYIFVKYSNGPEESEEQKLYNEKYFLPDSLLASIKSTEPESKNSIIGINLVLQFLFYELRNANKVRKWFYRKLSLELDELISKTTTGKLFDKLSIRDLDLGTQFPEIKNIRVHQSELHELEGHIESIDLLLDLNYSGNFKLSIDADMVLGKKAFLSVKVKHMSGLVRLQFTRKPYTHWSLSFLGDPQIDLDIETQFQGRQMQPNVTSLISNQIRKAIRRKHTLPNYKLRYKPFFHKIDYDENFDYSDIQLDGHLELNIAELTRIRYPLVAGISSIFCTLTLSTIPWILARKYDDKNIIITIDIEIHKAKNQQIGIMFKQIGDLIMIENVIPNTPAAKVGKFCKGDCVLSIDGKRIDNINQISKIIKNINRTMIVIRVERIVKGIIKFTHNCHQNQPLLSSSALDIISPPANADDDDDDDDGEDDAYEDFNDFNITFTKNTETVQFGNTKIVRKNSIEKSSISADSSSTNTPTNSPRKNTLSGSLTTIPQSNVSSNAASSLPLKLPSNKPILLLNSLSSTLRNENPNDYIATLSRLSIMNETENLQYSTADYQFNSFIQINDSLEFMLNEHSLYLNFNVFGRCSMNPDELLPLGYLNVSVLSILAECSESNLGNFIKQFTLIPPETPNLSNHQLSNQSGFDPTLCFGDVLMTFEWNGGHQPLTVDDKKYKSSKTSMDKLDDDPKYDQPQHQQQPNQHHHHHQQQQQQQQQNVTKQHVFIRKHFQRATQCDFCGKKIWLKDAVQCRDCSMCCHKKCINKCQNSTICGPIDTAVVSPSVPLTPSITTHNTNNNSTTNTTGTSSVEFKLTEPIDCNQDDFDSAEEPIYPKLDYHRQSFSDLIQQGLKRVNSANNLAIPGIVSVMNSGGSRSLPPSPQHTPRKQSLVNQSTHPFVMVQQKLEIFTINEIADIQPEQIITMTEPLIGWGTFDELMALAKSSSHSLYSELEPTDRVNKINELLSKIRIALDSETQSHANLIESTSLPPPINIPNKNEKQSTINTNNNTNNNNNSLSTFDTSGLILQTKGPSSTSSSSSLSSASTPTTVGKLKTADAARKAFLIGQSEERLQALSVIMLHLCTGLQYAQGIASHS